MRALFYLGHPAHFHLFRHTIAGMKGRGVPVRIVIKRKDILEKLLDGVGWEYDNVLTSERKTSSRWSTARGLVVRDIALLGIVRRFRPTVMAGTSAEITHVGRLLGIPSIVVSEDDWDVIPLFARLVYPFAHHILAPACCRMGRWAEKTTYYLGYHELSYLHPNHFRPDPTIGELLRGESPRYFILRFARLTAHHDVGRTGITDEVARRLIALLAPHGRVLITSERELTPEFEPYRIAIDPLQMHDAIASAALYVGDSQTMAAEAAVLGVPSVRFNDFVGEIAYLDELEERYGLTVGIRTSEVERLFSVVEAMLAQPDLKAVLAERRARMLTERIDLAAFLEWYFDEFPASSQRLARDPGNASRFALSPGAAEAAVAAGAPAG